MGKENLNSKDSKESSIKKRKKEENVQMNTTPKDLYVQTNLYEEQLALQHNPEDDLTMYLRICEDFRKIINEIAQLKTKHTEQAKQKIAEKRTEAALMFVTLKQLNRLEKFRTKHSRETLHKAKQQVDSLHLQLQNLMYEIYYLKKEVSKCLQFKSKADDIDLVSESDFFKEAPENITRQNSTKINPHQLKLARLEWELKQRKELASLCHDLQAEKEKVAAEIQKKQAHIDNLAPMLKNILNVAKPVQDSLGLVTGPSSAVLQTGHLLPHPLYFLFVQADAYRCASSSSFKVVCTINGDKEEAQSLKRNSRTTTILDDSDSDTQEETSGKRHHRKRNRAERLEERKKQLLMAHPLSVEITITLKDGNTISVEFFYLINLHVVTIKVKVKLVKASNCIGASHLIAGEHILTELFPDDNGADSPNIANYYQLKRVGIDSFDSSHLGIAYIWAQRVCGLNFSVCSGDSQKVPARSEVSQAALSSVMAAIKLRLRSRAALCCQIETLENGSLPPIPNMNKLFPQKLVSSLNQWSVITWQDYQSLSFTAHLISSQCVTSTDTFYKGVLIRGQAPAKMVFTVAIKNCYPQLPPVFALQTSWYETVRQASNNDCIRDIEREVNVFYKELLEKTGSSYTLLSAQVLRLVTCFDVLIESSPHSEFAREKIFLQIMRGRNRARPFKYLDDIGEGIFTQR